MMPMLCPPARLCSVRAWLFAVSQLSVAGIVLGYSVYIRGSRAATTDGLNPKPSTLNPKPSSASFAPFQVLEQGIDLHPKGTQAGQNLLAMMKNAKVGIVHASGLGVIQLFHKGTHKEFACWFV